MMRDTILLPAIQDTRLSTNGDLSDMYKLVVVSKGVDSGPAEVAFFVASSRYMRTDCCGT